MESRRKFGTGPSLWGSLQRRAMLPGRTTKQRPRALSVLLLLAAGAYCLLLLQQYHHDGGEGSGLAPRYLNGSRYPLAGPGIDVPPAQRVEDGAGAATPLSWRREGDFQLEKELSQRREKVWETCKTHGLVGKDGTSPTGPNAWEFFIDDRHHLVWCNVFKAASSSWMYNFNLLGGYKEQYLKRTRKSPLSLARSRFPRPSAAQLRAALPHSLSFLIVRDPFERLLSAYRNKIEGFRHKFYRKMAKDIISRFRVGTSSSASPTLHRAAEQRGTSNEKSPTFSEFVSWVIATSEEATRKDGAEGGSRGIAGFDEHWAPYFRFCTPCSLNFTVVAKMETLSRDEGYIIRRAGIASALGLKDGTAGGSGGRGTEKEEWGRRWMPREAVNAAIGGRTEDVLPQYFKTLTRRQLDDLYDIYRVDFHMFGYDASKYFEMVTAE